MTRLAILPAALLLGACAQQPDFGEQLRAEGGRVASLGESWTEGRGKVRRGAGLIRRGETVREDAREACRRTARTSAEG